MTKQDRERAEQIIADFPKWNRPMSTEESNLVDKFRDIQLNELMLENDNHMGYKDN